MNIAFHKYSIKTKSEGNQDYIYDIVRKKWIMSTLEEQVRQVWIHFLSETHGFSISNIAIEKSLKINNKNKRFDICVFRKAKPWILIECKSPSHKLGIPTFLQLSNYNISLRASVLIITNGVDHIGIKLTDSKIIRVNNFNELISNT